MQKDGSCWEWRLYIDDTDISDLRIYDNCALDNRINSDLYDGYGRAVVNDSLFDSIYTDIRIAELIAGNPIVIPGELETGAAGSTFTITFSANNVTYEINSASQTDTLSIEGDLGSDSDTKFVNIGGHFFSYQARLDTPEDLMPIADPILMWETNGTINFNDEDDNPTVARTGNMLQLKHYAYGYRTDGFSSSEEFFNLFLKFVDENKTRTDIFTLSYTPAAPVEVSVRKSTNLQFNEAMYGSDKLSDPDGQLRKTVDAIDAKYGYLIK